MLYDQYFIDDLKDRADLVRIIEPYARDLKKKGANWMACCPFHQEKTPSFSVNPQKGFYKCFGCGKGGNAFTFLMEMEGLNFPEAIQRVAEMAGVPLPEPIDDGQYQQNKQRREEKKQLSEQVIELNKIALEFWEAELQSKDKKAKAAREYLEQRGISEEVQKQFRIGFSPDSWQALHDHLLEKGADEKIIEQSGLVSVNEEKDRVFDRFRGRIMFPVLDINGNPIAFGARSMGDDQPKYLNSPETPAYVKGKHLYGLFQSKEAIRQKKFAILVEGYLDLIALYQFGITNVAASLGTAFTPEQSKLLSRFTKKVVINYDGDSAGIKAARRAIEELLSQDFEIKVLVLPNGQDPDDFIRANGTDAYNAARGQAKTYFDFALSTSMLDRNLYNARHRSEAIDEILPILGLTKDKLEKKENFEEAMSFFKVDVAARAQLWRSLLRQESSLKTEIAKATSRSLSLAPTMAETQLLELLLPDEDLFHAVFPILEEEDFENLPTAGIFSALKVIHASNLPLSREALIFHINDEETFVPLLDKCFKAPRLRQSGESLDDYQVHAMRRIVALRLIAAERMRDETFQEMILAEQKTDKLRLEALKDRHLAIAGLIRELKRKIAENDYFSE